MDFSIIEDLTDEELSELYDDSVMSDIYNTYMGGCHCYSPGRTQMNWGHHAHRIRGNPFVWAPYVLGYCAMKLKYYDDCSSWCAKHGLYYIVLFDGSCYCSDIQTNSTWDNCSR